MHAEICPVCKGKGLIVDEYSTSSWPTKTCHGCGGSGWVTVPDEGIKQSIGNYEKGFIKEWTY